MIGRGADILRAYRAGDVAVNLAVVGLFAPSVPATGRTVRVGPYDATATGNTLTQAMAAGHIADLSDLRRVVVNSFGLETFEPGAGEPWQVSYDRYLAYVD